MARSFNVFSIAALALVALGPAAGAAQAAWVAVTVKADQPLTLNCELLRDTQTIATTTVVLVQGDAGCVADLSWDVPAAAGYSARVTLLSGSAGNAERTPTAAVNWWNTRHHQKSLGSVYFQGRVQGVAGGTSVSPWLAVQTPTGRAAHAIIRFSTPIAGQVRLIIFDVSGRQVKTLVSGWFSDWCRNECNSMRPPQGGAHAIARIGRRCLETRRRRALALVQQGLSLNAAARRLGCAPSSVMRWMEAHHRHGDAGLKVRSAPGRPRRLTARQEARLLRELLRGALAHGYGTDLWTTERIAEVIERDVRRALSPRPCQPAARRATTGARRSPSAAPENATKPPSRAGSEPGWPG